MISDFGFGLQQVKKTKKNLLRICICTGDFIDFSGKKTPHSLMSGTSVIIPVLVNAVNTPKIGCIKTG